MKKDTTQQLLVEVKNYTMPTEAAAFLSQHLPLIISSVTASGKNTIANYILNNYLDYQETVSHTTRPPRSDEVDGVHYWFVSEAQMLELVHSKAFIEVKAVHGDMVYGTTFKAYKSVIENHKIPLLVIDVQGVEELRRCLDKIRPFFILPPNYEEWMKRLHSRGVTTEHDKAIRMTSARRELKTILASSAYILVVNDEVNKTAKVILSDGVDSEIQNKNRQVAGELLAKLEDWHS